MGLNMPRKTDHQIHMESLFPVTIQMYNSQQMDEAYAKASEIFLKTGDDSYAKFLNSLDRRKK